MPSRLFSQGEHRPNPVCITVREAIPGLLNRRPVLSDSWLRYTLKEYWLPIVHDWYIRNSAIFRRHAGYIIAIYINYTAKLQKKTAVSKYFNIIILCWNLCFSDSFCNFARRDIRYVVSLPPLQVSDCKISLWCRYNYVLKQLLYENCFYVIRFAANVCRIPAVVPAVTTLGWGCILQILRQ